MKGGKDKRKVWGKVFDPSYPVTLSTPASLRTYNWYKINKPRLFGRGSG
jgi:hypothetical protein